MMKKLTAERCKKQIEEWQRMMSVSDVAVMVELNLQAYLIALPVLEQQEKGDDGWIECSERMPEVNKSVLVWDGHTVNTAWLVFHGGWDSSAHISQVTHWQPLPEPPEDV
ncbi:MAG: DUF551 domain-containing protein [Pantoea sp.]|uniref:DUF551 domain-containing protein n=1 Tax=Pantoea sp. TaxID=69393 RepID=UPI0029143C6F|nr:DUF551 domain-containing protein [Pantoea sp.]MDU5780730.1 DUF551 domain-containing protein [Pantoea sp.]